MTDLVMESLAVSKPVEAVEHWHAMVMGGDLIASVVVSQRDDGMWTARTQLRDRSLRPRGESRNSGPFQSHEAACNAGRAAAARLHSGLVGVRRVPVERTAIMVPPPGGYMSRALRRLARANAGVHAVRPVAAIVSRAREVESLSLLSEVAQ